MNSRRESREGKDTAVFSRNHRKYLVAAAARSARSAGARVTFRAETRWVSASRALQQAESIPIYFAVVGRPPRVEYAATLCEVQLNPRRSAKRTQEILRHSLPASANEGLWETSRRKGPVQTLYVIRNCRRLKRPFPISRLMKVRGGSRLSSGYRYSYSLVRQVGV